MAPKVPQNSFTTHLTLFVAVSGAFLKENLFFKKTEKIIQIHSPSGNLLRDNPNVYIHIPEIEQKIFDK